MGRNLLVLSLVLNVLLNFAFLAFSGTLRLPIFSQDVKSVIFNDGPIDFVLADSKHEPYPSPLPDNRNAGLDPVVFAMVMYGRASATEGLLALKSALMHVSRPVEFHIICSPDVVDIIQAKLSLFSR